MGRSAPGIANNYVDTPRAPAPAVVGFGMAPNPTPSEGTNARRVWSASTHPAPDGVRRRRVNSSARHTFPQIASLQESGPALQLEDTYEVALIPYSVSSVFTCHTVRMTDISIADT